MNKLEKLMMWYVGTDKSFKKLDNFLQKKQKHK